MAASHLLKSVHAWTDAGFGEYDLLYWRDLEKREVDFVVTESRKPIVALECKLQDTNLSESLARFGKMASVPVIQLLKTPDVAIHQKTALIISADRYFIGFS